MDIRSNLKYLIFSIILFNTITVNVFAFNPFKVCTSTNYNNSGSTHSSSQSALCSSQQTSQQCTVNTISASPQSSQTTTCPGNVINGVTNVVVYVSGVLAVIFVMVSSYMFITSGGNPEKVKKAKNVLIYTVIGMIIIVLAKLIVAYVINYT